VGSLPFKEASSLLVSWTRSLAFGRAELEVLSVGVNAMAVGEFRSSCSFAVIQVDGVCTRTVQLRAGRSRMRSLRGARMESPSAVDKGMSSLRSLSARSKASAEDCALREDHER
jgi:hypothetical protein